jgi:hypothetical protein
MWLSVGASQGAGTCEHAYGPDDSGWYGEHMVLAISSAKATDDVPHGEFRASWVFSAIKEHRPIIARSAMRLGRARMAASVLSYRA